MRFIIALALITLFAAPCLSAPIAVFTPENPSGLDVVTVSDGHWKYKVTGGVKCVRLMTSDSPTNWYLYFKLDSEARKSLGSDVYLVVDFYDEYIGPVGMQFNTAKDPYTLAPGFLALRSDKWQRALIHLTGAQLAGRQNEGADFRFIYKSPISISRIEVYNKKPDVKIPSNKERVMKNLSEAKGPRDMFYTFGGDVDETTAPLYRSLGVTSIEDYVTWETCEHGGEGQWDWSNWDKRIKLLKDNDLKWVPFIILGPAYSTPNWFRASDQHVPCRCLEHEIDSKIESRWNPNLPKWIDRFIGEFAKRYGKSGMIESVLLGIQGDYGEAIYSVTGGGWTFSVPGEYHNHEGYWCDDPYALASFRKFVSAKYGAVDTVNKTWGASFPSLEKVDFPGRKDDLKDFKAKLASGDPQVRRRWLDFIDWYRESMTEWADWWISTTRKYFPNTPIYLCTGGDAIPPHGSNFAEQCRVAAKYKAGVRITNEASNYASNFVITRWVASAGKHYGAFYGFEPAGAEDEVGIVARIYNATASGANQLHDYTPNVVSSETRIESQRDHIQYLFHVPEPVVPVALWYPNVSMTLHWGGYFEKAKIFRDYTDYDYIDESMLHTNALADHKILVIVHGNVMETADAAKIAEWIKDGGRAIVMDVPKFESVEGTGEPEQTLFGDTPQGRTLGKGEITRVKDWDALVVQLKNDLTDLNLPVYDLVRDGIYGAQIGEKRFLFLNTGSGATNIDLECSGKTTHPQIEAGTITEVNVK